MPLRFLQELKLYGAIYIEQHETTCVICTSVVWLGSPVPIGLIYHMALITTYLACLISANMAIWTPDMHTAWNTYT